MTDRINDSRLIEWLRDLFADASAEAMFRWVIVAWLALVVAMVLLDRFGAGLLGRSRPLVQTPPVRARTWRWGRRTPPATYSLLPTGTLAESTAPPRALPVVTESIPLSRRPLAALPAAAAVLPLANGAYWREAAHPAAPWFGYENIERLIEGDAPERYNPITGRVESLDRDETSGALLWPGDATDPLVLGRPDATETLLLDPLLPDDAEPDEADPDEADPDAAELDEADPEIEAVDAEEDSDDDGDRPEDEPHDPATLTSEAIDADELVEIEAGAE